MTGPQALQSPADGATIIDDLRSATGAVHARLHSHPAFAPLTQPQPDAEGYTRLLRQFYGFHAPIEAWIFGTAPRLVPELDDLPHRRKMHLLRSDIAALQTRLGAAAPAKPPVAWPITPSRPAVLGVLYVIEGSTLGGRDLGRRIGPVLEPLGLAGLEGRQFLLAYDPRQGAMWRHFCATLAAVAAVLPPADRQTICAAALETFLAMETYLTGA